MITQEKTYYQKTSASDYSAVKDHKSAQFLPGTKKKKIAVKEEHVTYAQAFTRCG